MFFELFLEHLVLVSLRDSAVENKVLKRTDLQAERPKVLDCKLLKELKAWMEEMLPTAEHLDAHSKMDRNDKEVEKADRQWHAEANGHGRS